ncbi:DUF4249 domain-containing protein [Hymenobacter sp. BT186]|uniref:DUF4249 domain-containing protein n=1 Tax=Hymenobacter telluris TaxID=2816474 RepID=A0A939F2A9_9BACT|nr:DUF4249 domain-containing protein [Hymenobacter telluris]MBO0360800.1 DUF4249 domain-containing protein [Hymenobacter telluris]MBW3376829.1 DUF4249 domain-containing protein [Hymenobacter norwichensis]
MLDSLKNWLLALRFAWLLALAPLGACDLQQDIDVDIPVLPAQLVVECYLENGQLPQLTVTETVPYLATPEPVVPTDVTVRLTLPDGRVQTLPYFPAIDPTTGKGFTHIGIRRIVARPGDTFKLEVTDTKGRRVTGTATMPGRVPIDSLEYEFNNPPAGPPEAYVLTNYKDPPGLGDYYRFQIHRDSIGPDPEIDYDVDDRLTDGQSLSLGTSYQFDPGDTLLVTLYHIDRPYYLFRQSVNDARNANGNPFSQPSAIKSTVEGGIGVFTILSYDRKRLIIP